MAYADLSAEQKAQLDSWTNDMRALMGDFQRVLNRMSAMRDAYWVADGINDLFSVGGAWADGEVVPNNSGLAGAAVQTKSDFVNMMSNHIDKAIVNSATHVTGHNTTPLRQQRIAAAGPLNTQ